MSIFLLITTVAKTQNYGNEWIDYSQQYFKFPIYQTGIHRLDYNTINTALGNEGISISSINTSDFQVFGREQEVSIKVIDGGDNTLDPGDYLEFYAAKNDGWNDAYVYDSAHFQPDQYYSLFNDTIRYYLSWNSSGINKRIYQESDINYPLYNSINYVLKTNHFKYSSTYNEGPKYGDLSSPTYSDGEGWMSTPFGLNFFGAVSSLSTPISTKNVYTGTDAPNAIIHSVSASASASNTSDPNFNNHALKITYGSANIQVLDTNFRDYQHIQKTFIIPAGSLESPTTTIKHISYSIGQITDKQHVSSVTINYPHTLDFENTNYFEFTIPYNLLEPKSRLSITNFSGTSPILYLLNGDTIKEIPIVDNGGTWEGLLPNNVEGKEASCLLVDASNFYIVSDLSPVNNNGYFRNLSSISPTDAYVILSHSSMMNGAREFGSYRADLGGGYDTLVVDIEELYNQFGGGVYQHDGSIKRFFEMAIDNWPTVPSNIFLIGKSVRGNDESTSIGARHSISSYQSNFVPSFGYPCSDNHFTVGLGSNPNIYAVPTGRLSATSNIQVAEYLEKVKEYEEQQEPSSVYNIPNKEWQKNVLHFVGGTTQNEIQALGGYLNNFAAIIEDTLFGGMVKTYSKDPTSTVLNNDDFYEVQERLFDGVSLITFFGHASSGTGFSQNIDSPDNWNNTGKYPLVIGLGCYTGDVHQPSTNSYAENIVNPSDQGAIAFNSTVKLGYVSYLERYTKVYYYMLGKKHYGEPIGVCMKATVDSLIQSFYPNILFHGNINGLSLQGDPALKLNSHNDPELVLDQNRIWTTPSVIDLSVDSFDLNIVITNIGSAFIDTFNLEIERHFPNGADSLYTIKIPESYNRDTIHFTMASHHSIGIGINDFTIRVDLPFSMIKEQYDEYTNNEISFSTFISSNELLPIWPYEYAIIPWDTITCKASTLNPFASVADYIFEIDTTDLFNSPFKRQQIITSAGGVVEASPLNWVNSSTNNTDPITFADSTVYFWRCSPDSTTKAWQESSFQYIPDKWGWGQSHFFQYKNDQFTNINFNRTSRTFDFQASIGHLSCEAYQNIGGWTTPEWSGFSWKINGILQEYGGYSNLPAIHVAVIDPNTLKAWRTPGFDNGNFLYADHCFGQFNGHPTICPGTNAWRGGRSESQFIWQMGNSSQMDALVNFLDNIVPDGYYVLAYTYIPDIYSNPASLYASWPPGLFTSFQNLGATSILSGMQDDGFVFFCEKGDPSTAQEMHTTNTVNGITVEQIELLHFETLIEGSNTSGLIESEIAGPASFWNALYWQQHAQETGSSDTSRLQLYGIDNLGIETLLMDTLLTAMDSVINLTNIIDADQYPSAKLVTSTEDIINITPSQMDRWQLIYRPIPECALNPKKGNYFSINNDTIQEGDSIGFAVAIENVSNFDMDSLKVAYWIQDVNHTQHSIFYPRQDSLRAYDVLLDTIHFSTKNYTGSNSIWIAANPRINGFIQDQPEQFYFNNIAQKLFQVTEDNTNPILDVTFDGIHILNKDIVSSKPMISISLDDENEFLLMNEDSDTSLFEIFIKLPNAVSYEPLYFSKNSYGDYLHWEPATDSKNKFKIEYNPTFTEDGIYTLKVQGRDKSNNFSGDVSYEIEFEVITASTITHLFNYPNPFSTKTHFVFTLTGSEIPDDITIRIITITGKVVREIFSDELGPIHIGNNRTEFFWNGLDKYGDQLANGVYLYQVIAKLNGEVIEHRNTSADENSFKKGFGKMYLIR